MDDGRNTNDQGKSKCWPDYEHLLRESVCKFVQPMHTVFSVCAMCLVQRLAMSLLERRPLRFTSFKLILQEEADFSEHFFNVRCQWPFLLFPLFPAFVAYLQSAKSAGLCFDLQPAIVSQLWATEIFMNILIFNDSSFLCLLESTEVMERDCSLSFSGIALVKHIHARSWSWGVSLRVNSRQKLSRCTIPKVKSVLSCNMIIYAIPIVSLFVKPKI